MSEWQPSARYPDPCVVAVDPSFERYRVTLAKVERFATGMLWSEGPVWFGDTHSLIWSDVPGNCMYRRDEATGRACAFRQPSNNANGNTRDRQGRIVTCEHLTRRVTRTEYDGRITVLADSWDGKRLNSPNDVVVKSDGSVWFTDPVFGIVGFYKGTKETRHLLATEASAESVLPGGVVTRFRIPSHCILRCKYLGSGPAAFEYLAADRECGHWITSSARSRIACGIVILRAFAVFRFSTSSNVVDCSTGSSAGLAPFRIRSTKYAARR